MKLLKEMIKKSIGILSDPNQAFRELENQSLEEAVGFYAKMLLLVAVAIGISNILYSLLRALYLDIFISIDIQYMRMLNYTLGRSSSIIFFFLFAGTFLLFFISIIIKPFARKLKYADFLKILLYSAIPLLLFGWIPPTPTPFIVWSLFLLHAGIKAYKAKSIKRTSIHNRD